MVNIGLPGCKYDLEHLILIKNNKLCCRTSKEHGGLVIHQLQRIGVYLGMKSAMMNMTGSESLEGKYWFGCWKGWQ